MSYASAGSQLSSPLPLSFSDATVVFDGEPEFDSGATRQDAWLVSFIDILILLLTLFVLLLTYQEDATEPLNDKDSQYAADPLMQTVSITGTLVSDLEPPFLLSPVDKDAELFRRRDLEHTPSVIRTNTTDAVDTGPPVDKADDRPEAPTSPVAKRTDQSMEPLTIADASSTDGAQAVLQKNQPQPVTATDEQTLSTPDPMAQFLSAVSESELRDRVEMSVRGADVTFEIGENILFPPASAALTPAGVRLLATLATALKAQAYDLSIEGHTDNIPISTLRFPSNWELSTARAAIVARHLVKRGISAERIRAIGYADTRPRADNLTSEGRSRNRRVSLVLQIPSKHE